MTLEKCGKYELRIWEEGEFSTEGSRVASYSLYYENNQVGAVYTLADNVVKDIKTDPPDKGYGNKFLLLLMKRAKTLGYGSFIVLTITGQGRNAEEIKINREKMEHLVKKLGFQQISKEDNDWEIDIKTFITRKIGC